MQRDNGLLKVGFFSNPPPHPPASSFFPLLRPPATFNIYLERDVAVIPSGRGDKMNHLIASSAGRELTPGSGSPPLGGELIYERMRGGGADGGGERRGVWWGVGRRGAAAAFQ